MTAFPVSRTAIGGQQAGIFPLIPGISELLGLAQPAVQAVQALRGGALTAASPGRFFQPTTRSVVPIRDLTDVNPATGKTHFWRHMGTPVLFSGDLATVRRVSRIASRVNRRLGRRRPR